MDSKSIKISNLLYTVNISFKGSLGLKGDNHNIVSKLWISSNQSYNHGETHCLTPSLLQGRTEYVLYQITHMLQGRTQYVLNQSTCMDISAHCKNNEAAHK